MGIAPELEDELEAAEACADRWMDRCDEKNKKIAELELTCEIHFNNMVEAKMIADKQLKRITELEVGDINQGLSTSLKILRVDGPANGEGLPETFVIVDKEGNCRTYKALEGRVSDDC